MAPWDIGGTDGRANAGGYDNADHIGHTIAATGIEERPDTQTKFGVADAVHCNYWMCISCDLVWKEHLVFGKVLVEQILERAERSKVPAGRLSKGTSSSPGRNAPWILEDLTLEEAELVSKWLDAHAVLMPSGRLEIEPSAPKAEPDASEPF
jgi:hypothetical protein